MNLGRYTVSTPANPTPASISFTESVPGPSRVADDAPSAGKRKGKERETYRSASIPVESEPKGNRRSKRNGHFVIAGEEGFEVWSSAPELRQLLRRHLPGSLAIAHPLPLTPLFALVGGGRSPVFPPNKVILWLEFVGSEAEGKVGNGRAVASIEYGERVLRVVSRCNGFLVVLSQSVHYYEYGMADPRPPDPRGKGKERAVEEGFWLEKKGEWQTCMNERGLAALSVDQESNVLIIPGRQPGHIQLVQLPPCVTHPIPRKPSTNLPPNFRTPIVVAHEHALSALGCTSDGEYVVTASERGTLLRVWNVKSGSMERELRRGLDRADIWGVGMAWEPRTGGRELMLVCWSDKGTVHVWRDVLGSTADVNAEKRRRADSTKPSLRSLLDPYMTKSKYFSSTPSTVLFRLPRAERGAKQVIRDHSGPQASRPSMEELRLSEMYHVVWAERQGTPVPDKGDLKGRKRAQFDLPRQETPTLNLATHELIVVTHAGEWFRLGVPDGKVDSAEGEESDAEPGATVDRVDRCKVLEYRRLRTVSADW